MYILHQVDSQLCQIEREKFMNEYKQGSRVIYWREKTELED